LLASVGTSAYADVVFYKLPTKSRSVVILEGEAVINPGGTVSYTHPRLGKIHFDIDNAQVREAPSVTAQFNRQLNRAGMDANKRMEAAHWALRRGLLPQFWETIDKVLELDPAHPRAVLVKRLKAEMDRPIGDSSQQIAEMKKLIGDDDMRVLQSKHFVLMHDTPEVPSLRGSKLTRAQERLALLETVYEAFLLRFYAYGVELDVPKERMKVVLFNEHEQYKLFAERLSRGLSSASGFWDGSTNTSIFYDHGTNEDFKALKYLSDSLQQQKQESLRNRSSKTANLVRLADTVQMLVEIEREDSDIEVVSHETTHQMAGNTGLLPRHVLVPRWVHEGLATYFETPDGATWGGIGAVNISRLERYRTLQWDRTHSNIDFIVSDEIFDFAASDGALIHGYGQAWALTHFLLEKHFDKFLAFYRRLGELPPDTHLSADVVGQLFDDCLGADRRSLDYEWRAYMSALKTDVELILEAR
jgi:hypothetical protein